VLIFEVSKLSSQRGLVIQQTDGHVKTLEYTLGMSLELWQKDVVAIDALEQSTGFRMVMEQTNNSSRRFKNIFWLL
jgi:hypothetical protein